MISESMIVMVLLGCGNQLQSCDYIGTQSAGWTSVSECKDAIPVTIKQYQAAPYPVISARCGKEKLQRKDFARVVGDHSNHTTEGKILAIEGFEDFGPSMFELLRAKAQVPLLERVAVPNENSPVENMRIGWLDRLTAKARSISSLR